MPIIVGIEDVSDEGVFRMAEDISRAGVVADAPIDCAEPAFDRAWDSTSDAGDRGLHAESGPFGRLLYLGIDEDDPLARLEVVPGARLRTGRGRTVAIRIEAESGLGVDPACFGFAVEDILWDARSWAGSRRVAVERTDGDDFDLRIILASPDTTDALCRPLRTGGVLSCRRQDRVIINAWRWLNGATAFDDDLAGYRSYLINHEVGHFLGYDHTGCPAEGEPAPVMMQQTKGVGDCTPNSWPLGSERR